MTEAVQDAARGKETARGRVGSSPPPVNPKGRSLAMFLGRSLFPIMAVIIIGGTLLWGPWVTLAVAILWWQIVGRIA